jgi:hypothetical protein
MSDRLGHRIHGEDITVLSHLAPAHDHGLGRTCQVCQRRVNRYSPVALCDIHRSQAEDTGEGPVVALKPVRPGNRARNERAEQQRSQARMEGYRETVRQYGTTVYPDTPALTVKALLTIYVGTMLEAARRLGWTENEIRAITQPIKRSRPVHRLIPERKCRQLNKLIAREVRHGRKV